MKLRFFILGCSLSLCLIAFTYVAQVQLVAGLQMLPAVLGTCVMLVSRYYYREERELLELQKIRRLLEEKLNH